VLLGDERKNASRMLALPMPGRDITRYSPSPLTRKKRTLRDGRSMLRRYKGAIGCGLDAVLGGDKRKSPLRKAGATRATRQMRFCGADK
jgi:hypothetical protein